MAQIVKLKRTSVTGKTPTISNLALGELAMNTYDGRIFFEKSSSEESIQEILTTNSHPYAITGSLYLNGAVTASFFKGDGSQLTNLPTDISIAEATTVTASYVDSDDITVTHNFNSYNILVSVYDTNRNVLIPATTSLPTVNTARVTLSSTQSGYVVVAKGGHLISGSQIADNANKLNNQVGSYYLNWNNFNNIPSGIVSESSQVVLNDADKTGFDTADVAEGSNLYYTDTRVKTKLDAETVISSSAQLANTSVSNESLNAFTQSAITVSGNGVSGSLSVFSDTHTVVNSKITSLDSGTTLTHSNNGNIIFTVSGSNGELLTVTDSNTGNLLEVNDSSGVDVFIVSSSGDVVSKGHLLPDVTETKDLGSSSKRWRDLYLSGSTIDLGGTLITRDGSGDINFKDSGTQALKRVIVDELQIGSGTSARKIKVDGAGKIKFSDKDDVESQDDLSLPSGVISGSLQITSLTTHKETVSGASSYVVDHNLSEQYPIVQAWNTSTSQQELPTSITTNSTNRVTVVFSTTFAGIIIVKK